MRGIVKEFDAHVGLGTIQAESGDLFPFHCVNIVNGTRNINIGVTVDFETFDHPRGRTEARMIEEVN